MCRVRHRASRAELPERKMVPFPGSRRTLLFLGILLLHCLASSSAFMCPPSAEERPERLEGEECGGFCGGKGECAKGLVCEKAMMKSGLPSGVVNVLSGYSVGRCVRVDEVGKEPAAESLQESLLRDKQTESPKRKLGSKVCAGCLQDRDPHDEDIASAAKHAIELKKAAAGSDAALANMTYIRVLKAASQVVSGIKYVLVVEVQRPSVAGDDAMVTETYDVEIISQPWRDPKWVLSKFEKHTSD